MGVLYLVDSHTPTLLDSEINDTIPLEEGDTQVLNGCFGVNIPFGVPVDGTPANLSDLLTKKFTGLLAYYPGFTNITYDEGIDGSGWDLSNTSGATVGARGTTSVVYGGQLQSNTTALSSTPSAAVLTWELFEVTYEDSKDGVRLKKYQEIDPSSVDVYASFDGGGTWNTPTEGVQFSIPITKQGSSFVLYFSNFIFGSRRFWVGSWAVIY